MYGRSPSDIDSEVTKTALKDYEKGNIQIHERPANLLDPELENAKSEVSNITDDIDDVLIYALYPTTGLKFLRIKHGLDQMPEEMKAEFNPKPVFSSDQTTSEHPPKSQSTRTFNVYVEDEYFKVEVDPVDGYINQMVPTSSQSNLISSETNTPNASDGGSENSGPTDGETLVSPMPGILLRYLVEEGDEVKIGEPVRIWQISLEVLPVTMEY